MKRPQTIDNYELKIKKTEYDDEIYGQIVNSSTDISSLAKTIIGNEFQEHFVVFMLDVKNKVIGYYVAAVGGISHCPVDVRCVFRTALIVGATSIILAHNHPSGSTTPSEDDITLTKRVGEIARTIGLVILDHVIVTQESYYSLRTSMPNLFSQ